MWIIFIYLFIKKSFLEAICHKILNGQTRCCNQEKKPVLFVYNTKYTLHY